jgi:protein-L-isoaspartate(D-aspartate) O-methyltransferase
MDDYNELRKRLIETLVRYGYISKKEVIDAMLSVPREFFVPDHLKYAAYHDCPLEIGFGQTISAPHMVGIMTEKLDLASGQNVLEVGAGSGYQAAIIAKIIGEKGHVYTIERIEALVKFARTNLAKCGLKERVTVIAGDGSKGFAQKAPYHRIIVTCAAPSVPKPLIEQLVDNGKLLVPVGGRFYQDLICCTKKGSKVFEKNYGGCVFVPMVGEYGYKY